MNIENRFFVDRPVPEAWELLLDVPGVVPCVPGAELLEDRGHGECLGSATVKIGPIQLQFRGTVQIIDADDSLHTAKLVAKGSDRKGRGNANATSTFRLSPVERGTQVDIETDLSLTGTVAQYGRAQGLIQSVAEEIIRQFAENLGATLNGVEPVSTGNKRPISAIALGAKVLKSKFGAG